MTGKRLDNIMSHLESTSAHLDDIIARVGKTVSEGKVDKAMDETLVILSEARQLIRQTKNDIASLRIQDKAEKTDLLLTDLDKKTRSITAVLQDTSENLRTTSENLQKLSDSLNRDPSELIFSKPAPPRKPMEEERKGQ
jgi:DNA repair ATPase RecN